MRKKRESYCSMSKDTFLNKDTGPYLRLDSTAWYLKKNKTGTVAVVEVVDPDPLPWSVSKSLIE